MLYLYSNQRTLMYGSDEVKSIYKLNNISELLVELSLIDGIKSDQIAIY